MRRSEELERVAGRRSGGDPPPGFELDRRSYPGGEPALARAREVMLAVLEQTDLPGWFIELCVDDRQVQSCTLDRWSLRAWVFWLQEDNRRWWWWEAEALGDEVSVAVLVRARPYLRGSLDWLFRAAASSPA